MKFLSKLFPYIKNTSSDNIFKNKIKSFFQTKNIDLFKNKYDDDNSGILKFVNYYIY